MDYALSGKMLNLTAHRETRIKITSHPSRGHTHAVTHTQYVSGNTEASSGISCLKSAYAADWLINNYLNWGWGGSGLLERRGQRQQATQCMQ